MNRFSAIPILLLVIATYFAVTLADGESDRNYVSYSELCNIRRPGFYNVKDYPYVRGNLKFKKLPLVKRKDCIYVSYGSDFRVKKLFKRKVVNIFCNEKFSHMIKANFALNYTITMNTPEVPIVLHTEYDSPTDTSFVMLMHLSHASIRIKPLRGIKKTSLYQHFDSLRIVMEKFDGTTSEETYPNYMVTTLDLEPYVNVEDEDKFISNKIWVNKNFTVCAH